MSLREIGEMKNQARDILSAIEQLGIGDGSIYSRSYHSLTSVLGYAEALEAELSKARAVNLERLHGAVEEFRSAPIVPLQVENEELKDQIKDLSRKMDDLHSRSAVVELRSLRASLISIIDRVCEEFSEIADEWWVDEAGDKAKQKVLFEEGLVDQHGRVVDDHVDLALRKIRAILFIERTLSGVQCNWTSPGDWQVHIHDAEATHIATVVANSIEEAADLASELMSQPEWAGEAWAAAVRGKAARFYAPGCDPKKIGESEDL